MLISGESLYIIFTSNINGNIENCGCGPDPLGGVARLKTVVDDFRQKHKNVLVIDGGDFFNSYSFVTLNNAMASSLKSINYDILVPGDQEFVEGFKWFESLPEELKNKIILSNSNNFKNQIKNMKVAGHKLSIQSYLSPSSFRFIKQPQSLYLSTDIEIFVKDKRELNIFIFHGTLNEAKNYADKKEFPDIILLGHDQQEKDWQYKNTKIISGGRDLESLAIIEINNLNSEFKYSISRLRIDESIPENGEIKKYINEYKLALKNENQLLDRK